MDRCTPTGSAASKRPEDSPIACKETLEERGKKSFCEKRRRGLEQTYSLAGNNDPKKGHDLKKNHSRVRREQIQKFISLKAPFMGIGKEVGNLEGKTFAHKTFVLRKKAKPQIKGREGKFCA